MFYSNHNSGDQDKYFGMIPKEYVKDKTKLALVGTIVALAVVVLIGLIYFIVAKKRLVPRSIYY